MIWLYFVKVRVLLETNQDKFGELNFLCLVDGKQIRFFFFITSLLTAHKH